MLPLKKFPLSCEEFFAKFNFVSVGVVGTAIFKDGEIRVNATELFGEWLIFRLTELFVETAKLIGLWPMLPEDWRLKLIDPACGRILLNGTEFKLFVLLLDVLLAELLKIRSSEEAESVGKILHFCFVVFREVSFWKNGGLSKFCSNSVKSIDCIKRTISFATVHNRLFNVSSNKVVANLKVL